MRRVVFLLLALIALPLGAVAAGLIFLLTAPALTGTLGRSLVSLAGCFAVSWGLGWLAARVLSPRPGSGLALGIVGGVCLTVVVVAALTVFKPMASDIETAGPSGNVQFWDLPTGSRIAFRRFEPDRPGLRPPVVFLHGGPGAGVVTSRVFTDVLARFTDDGFEVYVYDQVGGGYSARLADVEEYTAARHVADLEAIRRLIGAETLWLIAESWGAELALRYAAEHPERVEGLVLVSPGDLDPESWGEVEPCDPLVRIPGGRQRLRELLTPRFLMTDLLLDLSPKAAHDFLPDAEADAFGSGLLAVLLEGALCDPRRLPPDPGIQFAFWGYTMTDLDSAASELDPHGRLAASGLRVLILRGECDYCLPEVAQQYLELLPEATLVRVADAGHLLFVEQPERFLETVRSFLAGEG